MKVRNAIIWIVTKRRRAMYIASVRGGCEGVGAGAGAGVSVIGNILYREMR